MEVAKGTWPALGILWDSRKPDRPCQCLQLCRDTQLCHPPQSHPRHHARHTPPAHMKCAHAGVGVHAPKEPSCGLPHPFHLPGVFRTSANSLTSGDATPTPQPRTIPLASERFHGTEKARLHMSHGDLRGPPTPLPRRDTEAQSKESGKKKQEEACLGHICHQGPLSSPR